MNAGGVQVAMPGLSVLRHSALGAPLAIDAAGETVSAGRFLSHVQALTAHLPDAGYIVNLCADRYRFAVGFFAALLRRQITLLPSSEAAAPMSALLVAYPNTYFLTDARSAVSGTARTFCFPDDLSGEPSDTVPAIASDQPAAVLFTSGSTGTPAPHVRSWGAMVNSTRAAGLALKLDGVGDACIIGTVPHQHSYGLESIIMLALQHGLAFHRGRALLPGDIARQLSGIPARRILVTTPVHLRSLVTFDGALPALDRIVCATAPLTADLAEAAEGRFAAPLYEIYGCTEVGQMAVRRTTKTPEWVCIDGIALHEHDGEIWASGEAAAATAPVGDIIDLIDAKRFLLKDRKSDVVNIAGKRSSLGYLNHHLNAIAGVRDGVFVVPEDGRRLTAYVVAPGLSAGQILAALRPQLDPAFLPRPIHFVDSLPRNAVGKLTRTALDGLSRDGWASRAYRFASDHPTAAGHFPDNPIIPGALLLDRMLDAMGRAGRGQQEVRVVKFLQPVRPDDAVIFRWRENGRDIAFECVLTGSGEIALSGSVAT
ncbi:MAG TPA: AMP-binding protein [Alphaproteobacteria bacterium]|jgi:acyl-coenzyme A synthetase/AMP-(fatty) acid ligase|nr:AMP-binding protein [Alphaproteobacteria bacterium]